MKIYTAAGLATILVTALTLTGACSTTPRNIAKKLAQPTYIGCCFFVCSGALGCYKNGNSVANKKAQYVSDEVWLQACLAEVQTANKDAAAFNHRLQTTLNIMQWGGQPAQSAAKMLKESREVSASLDDIISSQEQALSSATHTATVRQIRKEIDELKKVKASVDENAQKLAHLNRGALW